VGDRKVEVLIERASGGRWNVNGDSLDQLIGLQDIDLGFTPASNTNAIRRLNLSVGDEAQSAAAWLDTEDWTVKPLQQTYRRLARGKYEYESPAHDFRASLAVDEFGAVQEYPTLWTMVSPRSR
jgi:uncharacterized protein